VDVCPGSIVAGEEGTTMPWYCDVCEASMRRQSTEFGDVDADCRGSMLAGEEGSTAEAPRGEKSDPTLSRVVPSSFSKAPRSPPPPPRGDKLGASGHAEQKAASCARGGARVVSTSVRSAAEGGGGE
jgi:hypothetical protein